MKQKNITVILLVVFIVLVCMLTFLMYRAAVGEDEDSQTVYVLCNPESYVNIREKPNKKAHLIGYAYCGDDFRTDGTIRNGFIHVIHAGTETGDGWISTGFIAYSEPSKVDEVWKVESNGRVAARSTIGGKRTRWLKKNADVTVYYVAEVAVTNYGFVDAKYVGPVAK